jgi:hypothetical protein
MIIYDYIIVGSGPAGLTFATLADKNDKIMIIDKDKVIGGCHKVNRQKFENEYYFTEHGPRFYFSNYLNFKTILSKIGVKFSDIFVKYNLSFLEILYQTTLKENVFSINEIFIMTIDFFKLMGDPNYGNNMSLNEYLTINNFSDKAINYINRTSRFMDGGDLDKTSLNSFFNVLNDTLLYNGYQPKMPNDEGLFLVWRNYLKNVDFKMNTTITDIDDSNNIIKINSSNNGSFYAKKLIMAIPPINLNSIIKKSSNNIKNKFKNNLEIYAEKTEYIENISIIFHWNFKLNLDKKIYGFHSNTNWGIGAIVLSDYMNFKEKNSKTVISCVITINDVKSKNINKTANECSNKEELIDEVYRQLNEIYNNLPVPTLSFVNSYYKDGKWISNETAFVKATNYGFLNNKITDNIYTLGTHNGNAKYHFTSMETAVSNSIYLVNQLYNKNYSIKRPYTIKYVIIIFLLFMIFLLIINLFIFNN